MAITTTAVSTISLTYSTGTDWAVFDATTRCSAANLQSNWNDITSQIGALYMPLINSAVDEIGVHSGALASATADISALKVSAPYAGSAATAQGALSAAGADYAVSALSAAGANYAVSCATAGYAVSAGTAKYA
jgi:hypothetical protein